MADDDIEGVNALAGFRNPAQAQAPLPPLDAIGAINAAAARYGLNPVVLKGIASIESSMDPESNRNKGTQYKGLFQIGRDEWKQYGRGDVYNPADNADAAARMFADHAKWYSGQYGREPTPGDLYMMHLQGRGFIKNGTMTNVAKNPYLGMQGPQTPESFAQGWANTLTRRMAPFGGANSIYGNQATASSLPTSSNSSDVLPSSGGVVSTPQSPLASQSFLAPPTGGVQSALAGLGSPSSGGGTFAGIGKSLMAQAGKTQGLPFPDAKLKPFDENLRPLPLNLPNFAAMAQIPKFAEGGIVDRPTVAMVGENGPEAIVPLTGQQSLERQMSDPGSDAPRQALDARALLNSGAIRITHPGDGRGGFSQTNDPNDFSIVSHYNDLAGGTSSWPNKPESYEAAIIALNNAHQPGPGPLYNGKYNQILWSAQRLGMNPFKALPPRVPGFAEGGIVDRPTVAMVGENGPEAVVPLSRSAGGSFPYLGMLEQAGRFMPPVNLPDQPSVNIQRRLGQSRVPMHIGRSIPGFAEGGIVDRPTLATIGEDGPEAIVPLDPFERAAARTRAPYAGANARTSGLPEFIDYLRNRMASTATAPLRALTGQMQVTDPATGMPTPEAMREGQSVANVAMTGAIPFAQRGAAGVFGGKLGSSEALPKLRSAFDSVRAAQGNVGIAPISELIAQSGLSKEAVHKALLDAAQRGEVTLHQGNQAGESQVIRDAAISFPGEPPLKYAFFKNKPAEPKSREEIRRELREGMARSKLGGPSERIGFKSAGAQRDPGKAPAERQPAVETPEAMAKRKVEMKAAFDELMKKGKPEKTKTTPSALTGAQRGALGMAGGRMSIPTPLEQLHAHYTEAVKELGTPQIPISELISRSGLSKEVVHKHLLAASREGQANLYPSTVPLETLPKGVAEGAIHHSAFDEPRIDVEFKSEPSSQAAPSAPGRIGFKSLGTER